MRFNLDTCTKEEFTSHMDKIIRDTARELNDSPVSRNAQIQNHIGYISGVCAVKHWDMPIAQMLQWEKLI